MRLLAGLLLAALCAWSEPLAILRKNCGGCHGETKMGGLDLRTREAALKGGTRGAAIVVGKPEASLLYQAVAATGKLAMPPGNQRLAASDVAELAEWIRAGASWDGGAAGAAPVWWSFRKPVRPAVPTGSGSEIDRFVRARLARQSLSPAPRAKPEVLVRRLAYDLTGLPPARDQVSRFAADPSDAAWAKLVDEMLASPHYGEKWGRYWLDLVRYADTAGFELDSYIADAWRYRDWVIDSFNEDKPYDRFIREQIAGDEYYPEDPVAQTGTGLYCVGPNRDLFPDQADINRVEILTDYVDTTSAVFLGLTAGCARCHDHKFDPIPQRDYYRLQAVFAPAVKTAVPLNRLGSLGHLVSENTREIKLREIGEQIGALQSRCRKAVFEQKTAGLDPEIREALRLGDAERTQRQRELATEYGDRARVTDDGLRACLNEGERTRLGSIEKQLVSMFAGYRSKPFACGITDPGDYGPATYIPARGGHPATPVEPGVFSALGGGDIRSRTFERPTTGPIPLTPTTGRRHDLAAWIASPDNPLTARVMVNRIWQFHFGRGIVATPSDYGSRGSAPTHPELLDWLATEFVAKGWSLKSMHRLILNSETWRQSAEGGSARHRDPENLWLSYFRRRRLDSDEIRDSALQAAGALNRKAGGRPVVPPLSKEEMFNMIGRASESWVVTADAREHDRRAIYLMQKRTFRLPMMEVFDAPETMVTCPRRDSSTTAPQSLTMLNGRFAVQQSQRMAERLSALDDAGAIREAWQSVLLREPAAEELTAARAFLERQTVQAGGRGAALAELARGLMNLNEFLYVD